MVYTDNPTRCRLCALLISRLCDENPRSDMFAVQYVVDLREGYVMDIFDLVFFLQHEGEAADRRVRLGIQQVEPKGTGIELLVVYTANRFYARIELSRDDGLQSTTTELYWT